jgi:hypothetical protein
MPNPAAPHSPGPTAPNTERPKNRETEYEDYKTAGDGRPPRSANEPRGAEGSSASPDTATDPASGEDQGHPATPRKVGSEADDAAKRRPG